ncbi:MAG: hypothetical protein Q9214_007893, partial [Letrouitia sp. 1 TL-2023]
MSASGPEEHTCCPETATSHPKDPVPEEPKDFPSVHICPIDTNQSAQSSATSLHFTDTSSPDSPSTPATDPQVDDALEQPKDEQVAVVEPSTPRRQRRASTKLISQSPEDVKRILVGKAGANTELIEKVCCGGGCCFLESLYEDPKASAGLPVVVPNNDAFRSLGLKLGPLSLESELTKLAELPMESVSFLPHPESVFAEASHMENHPPQFVTPHHPYEVFSAKVHHARELTKSGAEKRTYHFDLDVTDYPAESGDVDFVVGGAVGVCPPNSE